MSCMYIMYQGGVMREDEKRELRLLCKCKHGNGLLCRICRFNAEKFLQKYRGGFDT